MFERLLEISEPIKPIWLEEQYRMSPDICQLVSELFYDKQIINRKKENIWKKPLGFLISKFDPSIMFIDVKGYEEREHGATSIHNWTEIEATKGLLHKIFCEKRYEKAHSKIGIISFYKAQTEKLKKEINGRALDPNSDIEISTVDGFQGKEKEFIILSCVRSQKLKEAFASRCIHIGFLNEVRRINVAFSRSREALIVLGNASILESDVDSPLWKTIISKFKSKKAFFCQDILK